MSSELVASRAGMMVAFEDVTVGDQFVAQFAREQSRLDLAHDDVGASVGHREEPEWRAVDRDALYVVHEASQAVGER